MLLRKIWDKIIGCWPTRSFLRTFTCIIFFPFPGLAKCFQWDISHIFCLHKLLFNYEFMDSSIYGSSISVWLGAIPDALSSALHFDLYFFTNRLYRSRTDLGVTLKKGSSTNEFKIAAILSQACPLSTLPWRCIQGWICRISLKNKMSCCSVQNIDRLMKKNHSLS